MHTHATEEQVSVYSNSDNITQSGAPDREAWAKKNWKQINGKQLINLTFANESINNALRPSDQIQPLQIRHFKWNELFHAIYRISVRLSIQLIYFQCHRSTWQQRDSNMPCVSQIHIHRRDIFRLFSCAYIPNDSVKVRAKDSTAIAAVFCLCRQTWLDGAAPSKSLCLSGLFMLGKSSWFFIFFFIFLPLCERREAWAFQRLRR